VGEASTLGLGKTPQCNERLGGLKRGSAITMLNKLKTHMAALATNVPKRPTEGVSRIRSAAQDTDNFQHCPLLTINI
jgi:hypothetical protein